MNGDDMTSHQADAMSDVSQSKLSPRLHVSVSAFSASEGNVTLPMCFMAIHMRLIEPSERGRDSLYRTELFVALAENAFGAVVQLASPK
jgi:hypothetical protein